MMILVKTLLIIRLEIYFHDIVRQEYEHQPDLKRDNIYLLNQLCLQI